MLRAFAAALEQPEDIFAPIYTPAPNPLIKIIRYPGRASSESDQGVGAHKDSGFVTLLLQEKQAGLQVQADDGGWIDAPPVAGTFVVNIGEILEMASNGYLRANVHRVVSPPQGSDRLSVALLPRSASRRDGSAALAAASPCRASARRDAGPGQSALPGSRPQLPEEPAALPSRRRAPPLRGPDRSRLAVSEPASAY